MSGIFGNALRDPPDNGVAGWVSANDKPTATGPKASVSGDAAEQRLKIEITRLPLRDRARLKRVQDDAAADRFVRSMLEWREAKSVKVPEMTQSATGGVTRTSKWHTLILHGRNGHRLIMVKDWELEIRKRFSQPLCSEALEVPDADSLLLRMGPLCYEEGLTGGPAAGTADFMNTATETFIKEALNHLFSRSRSNGPVCGTGGAGVTSHSAVGGAGWVMTGRYKKRIRREEDLCARGQLRRDATGLLPAEAEEARKRRALGVGDLKLSLRLGDPWLAQMPLVSDKLLTGIFEEVEEDSDSDSDSDEAVQQIGWEDRKPVTVNGSTPYTNGVKDDEMSIDENDWGWPGCARRDHQALGNVLDDCLSVTQ